MIPRFFCVYGSCFEREDDRIKIMPADNGNYPIIYVLLKEKKLVIRFVNGEVEVGISNQDIDNILSVINQQYKAYKRIYG